MRKLRVLFRVGRLLSPSTVVLRDDGVLEIVLASPVSESTKIKGSLSPAEIGSIVPGGLEFSLRERECEFSTRRLRRKMKILDREERNMLKHLGVDLSKYFREGTRPYGEIYLVKLLKNDWEYSFIASRKSMTYIKNYLAKYCLEVLE
ncbi:MAG: hypothetical protein RMH84_04275 [Sulfolobales archaeon]|nr:hypothetical protein [Sulfolobales archaeon]MCX8208866.1 hypothetical protein [Sulfolobales archaeon]MDW8010791.1 hypothetical protein [Sulfolobales archaeon]